MCGCVSALEGESNISHVVRFKEKIQPHYFLALDRPGGRSQPFCDMLSEIFRKRQAQRNGRYA
ncbi:hypothetical protein TRIP_B250378 [uncultured Desulfatiglans sp.]|nr:hypothetical protein TRIP_B250378 [uncultured Desulfatiglans sp.]